VQQKTTEGEKSKLESSCGNTRKYFYFDSQKSFFKRNSPAKIRKANMFKNFLLKSAPCFCLIFCFLSIEMNSCCVAMCDQDACCECVIIDPMCEWALERRSHTVSKWAKDEIEEARLLRTETYLERTGTYVGDQPVSVEKTREIWSEPRVKVKGHSYQVKEEMDNSGRKCALGCLYVPTRLIETGLVIGATAKVWMYGAGKTVTNLSLAGAVFSGLNTAMTLYSGPFQKGDHASRCQRTTRWLVDLADTALLITAASFLKTQDSNNVDDNMLLASQALLTTSAVLNVINLGRTVVTGCLACYHN
jgi:hypothetical protein